MPAHWKLRTVRADSGFFENALLTFLEARGIPYIVVAKLTQTVKRKAAGLATWTPIDENYAWARFSLQLQGWSAPREFFAIRERIRENKSAVGRRLIDVDGYTFRVFVTNRQGDGAELWRDYNQRACCEQHIEELKNDLQADGFCMNDFYATESTFLGVCFTYNLLSLYQHASAPDQRKASFKRPATLRAAVFIGGAALGTRSRTPVLYIAQSWGGSTSTSHCWTTFYNDLEQLRRSCRQSHPEPSKEAAKPRKNTAPLSRKSSNFGVRVKC